MQISYHQNSHGCIPKTDMQWFLNQPWMLLTTAKFKWVKELKELNHSKNKFHFDQKQFRLNNLVLENKHINSRTHIGITQEIH